MKIVYLGDPNPQLTGAHRAAALGRLGHQVEIFNPSRLYPQIRLLAPLHVRTGFRLIAPIVEKRLRSLLGGMEWDLLWVDAGPELNPGFYRWAKARGQPVVNYNCDNPFVRRDFRKWDLYKKTVRYHDLTLLPREKNIEQAKAAGSRLAHLASLSYDPVAHDPAQVPGAVRESRELVFVGSWMPERGPFMAALVQRGIPLQIFGDHWPKAREWKVLQTAWKGPALYGPHYVQKILEAKVALGLLSQGNEDEHTQRSAEIPFMQGGVFCAPRTPKHLQMFREGEEAVFWESPGECASQVQHLLLNPARRAAMSRQARQRVIQLKISNDEVLARALALLER